MGRTMAKHGNGDDRGPTRAWKTAFAAAMLLTGLGLLVSESLGLSHTPMQYLLPLIAFPASWAFGIALREWLGRGDT